MTPLQGAFCMKCSHVHFLQSPSPNVFQTPLFPSSASFMPDMPAPLIIAETRRPTLLLKTASQRIMKFPHGRCTTRYLVYHNVATPLEAFTQLLQVRRLRHFTLPTNLLILFIEKKQLTPQPLSICHIHRHKFPFCSENTIRRPP